MRLLRKQQPTPNEVHIDTFDTGKGARMGTLSTAQRENLPDSDFALPGRRYPYHDLAHARAALSRVAQHGSPEEQAKVKAAVHRRYPALAKAEWSVPIWKSDAHTVVGVVLEPDLVDSQEDLITADEIAKAAHDFLVQSRRADIQHNEQPTSGVDLVESFCAPQDFEIDGQPVRKGAWVVRHRITNPDVWDAIEKGELTGYSLGGTGTRVEA